MKANLIFDAQFAGRAETTLQLHPKLTERLSTIFKEAMGLDFDDNCTIIINKSDEPLQLTLLEEDI